METRSKKAVVSLVTVVAGFIVIVVAGLALKEPLQEQWYLWQAESSDRERKKVALAWLEKTGSARAIPRFLELILEAQIAPTPVKSPPRTWIYDVPDVLRVSTDPADFSREAVSRGEALADLIWEIVRSRGQRPGFGNDLASRHDRLYVWQSQEGHEAIQAGLGVLKRVGPLIERIGVSASPYLNAVLRSDDAEKVVKLFARLEFRQLIADLKAREDIGSLSALLADKRIVPEVRAHVITAIGGLGERAEPAVPLLIAALGDESLDNRVHAADALHDIGAAAEEAIPALKSVSREDDAHQVRRSASYALERIVKTSDS